MTDLTPSQTNNDLIGGHPLDGSAAPAQVAASAESKPAAQAPAAQPTAVFQPVWIGGRKFDSADELAQYTAQLETQKAQWSAPPVTPANIPADPDKELSDVMFEDPLAYTKLVKEAAKREIQQEYATKEYHTKLWNDFYDKNPDLKNYKYLVEASRNEIRDGLATIKDINVQADVLAKDVRKKISEIRQSPSGNGTELPSGQAIVSATSNGPGVQGVQAPEKRLSLVEQLQQLRANKTTRR